MSFNLPRHKRRVSALRALLFFAITWTAAPKASAQLGPAPRPVDLVVNVHIDRLSNAAAAGVTVELQNGFGSNEQVMRTDNNGSTFCHTLTGSHRLHIFGPDLQDYQSSFDIEPTEVRHTENVVVRSKSGPSAAATSGTAGDLVAVSRLKVPEKADSEFKKGSKSLEQKNWAEAKKHFEAATAIYPEFDIAYNGLGSALAGTGDIAGARTAFEKAIDLNANFAEAERNLARISFAERKYDEALTLLNKSLSTDPFNPWALTSAANAALLTHHYEEAIGYARKAHGVPHPGFAGVHIVAALALEATQQPSEAIKHYQLYLEEDPKGRDVDRAQKAIQRLKESKPNQ
jgi:tetratricopeptide (TPR) repeat protein